MLIGEYMQTVDAKFRVNIPSKFRTDLGQTLSSLKESTVFRYILKMNGYGFWKV